MPGFHWSGQRKRRPREHVIGDMGMNFLERQVLRRGHQLVRVPQPEYGTDALMLHFSPDSREIENGCVEFQVKSTDHLSVVADGLFVTCAVEMAHLHYWYWEVHHPFILIVYDAERHRAFWQDVQAYVDECPNVQDAGSETVVVRIPSRNRLTLQAISLFRDMSLARTENLS